MKTNHRATKCRTGGGNASYPGGKNPSYHVIMNVTELHWRDINAHSGVYLVPLAIKVLPALRLTQIYVNIQYHLITNNYIQSVDFALNPTLTMIFWQLLIHFILLCKQVPLTTSQHVCDILWTNWLHVPCLNTLPPSAITSSSLLYFFVLSYIAIRYFHTPCFFIEDDVVYS